MDICGPDYARPARSIDAVGGQRAEHVAIPATAQAVGDILRLAADEGRSVVPRGSGSKINWGAPRESVDLLLDTGRLNGLWNHDVGARTVEVATGTPVRALQAALALRGQRLPVDPPSRTATVGGMLAVNECGPLRQSLHTPAEHVDRVSYVDAAGHSAESDGEQGRPGLAEIAGVLTSAVVRLQPLPLARRWVTVPVASPATLLKIPAPEPATAALEVDLPGEGAGALVALIEGDVAEVADRSARLIAAWGRGASAASTAPLWWGRYPFGPADVALRLSAAPVDLPAMLYSLADASGVPVPVRGSAGLGNVHAVLPGVLGAERIEGIVESLRHVQMARGGRAVLVAAPAELAAGLEMAARQDYF
ncbi:2-hydroxy-acid oxidase [Paractinoplanes durhamensis]|uniref:2-hydroxy-acid oxidase n=1 Tax=Paractinoplanes durhamensis TaxID=113563 RepID=A0ABQ3Z0Y5_9ACTN|nr:2-hydroxy-acid oxidase [Actinoplanes durhamensis]